MNFSIDFLDTAKGAGGPKGMRGRLTLGGYSEDFIAELGYWKTQDYENHWIEAARRVVRGKNSCLITSLTDPKRRHFGMWWPIYVNDESVLVQNQLLIRSEFSSPFAPLNPFTAIPKHESVDEDGEKISEWKVRKRDFEAFLVTHAL